MTDRITIRGRQFALRCLPAGTTLYHGTDAPEDFSAVRAPGWFATDPELARIWPKRTKPIGNPRVLTFRASADLWLFDVPTPDGFRRLYRTVTGATTYPGPFGRYTLARMLRDACLPGWIGGANQEVLLTNTDAVHRVENP